MWAHTGEQRSTIPTSNRNSIMCVTANVCDRFLRVTLTVGFLLVIVTVWRVSRLTCLVPTSPRPRALSLQRQLRVPGKLRAGEPRRHGRCLQLNPTFVVVLEVP